MPELISCLICGRKFTSPEPLGKMIPGLGYVCAMDFPGFAAGFQVGRTGSVEGERVMEDPAVAARDRNVEKLERLLAFDVTPREIAAFLDEYVVGQAAAKRATAVAVYNHHRARQVKGVEISKSNMLFIGPTGVGKTEVARTLARFLEVPFTIADATNFTPAGYVGDDVENMLMGLMMSADGDEQWAAHGMVFIDEIDKTRRMSADNPSITRDIGGECVQQAMLKILEGTEARLPFFGGRKHPQGKNITINTKDILFIGSGAFEGLPEIVAKLMRQGETGLGFRATARSRKDDSDYRILQEAPQHILQEALLEYGFIPEFVGRFPVIVPFQGLEREEFRQILTRVRHSVLAQQEALFALDGVDLVFTDDAIDAIISQAVEMKSGARALRSLVERAVAQARFELPQRGRGRVRCTINAESVKTGDFVVTPLATGQDEPLAEVHDAHAGG
ncbi:MAG: ATP-dependent Clp protease ATP-binding subunit ClpX [Armatimonadetes bacterium]|nr:ATP-dependent Clp protease ATP-binding subunit ClpX [Armatimonadota bacterium]